MRRAGLACVAVLVLGVLSALFAAGTAEAGDVNGHLFVDRDGDGRFSPGDTPSPVTILVFRRIVSRPGEEFQLFVMTRPDGSYQIAGLPPGTYLIRAPMLEPSATELHQVRDDGTVVLLPGGVPVAEGPPTTVDLPLAPPPAPVFRVDVPNNVIAGLVTYYTTIPEVVDPAPQVRSETLGLTATVEVPLRFFNPDAVVVMERTPAGGGAMQVYETSGTEASNPLAWMFSEAPLAVGDHVRIYLDPDQDLLDGFVQVFPTVVEFDYAGGLPPTVEFRLRPVHTQTGRVFLDACPTTDGVYDAGDGDVAVGGHSVKLWTLDAPPPAAPMATTTTAADGTYSFGGLLPGFYLVGVAPVGAASPPELFRTFEDDPPEPADFPVAFSWAVSIATPGELTVECTAEHSPVTVPTTLVRPAAAAVFVRVLVDGAEWGTLDVPAGTPPGDEGLLVQPLLHVGEHEVVVEATAGGCGAESAKTIVHVVDTTAPSVSCGVETSVIGPPMSGTENVGFHAAASDTCDPTVQLTVEVFSNESGSPGNQGDDAGFDAQGHLLLRRWRDPKGDGRVYLIIVRARDDSGNESTACCCVVVPQSNSAKKIAAAEAMGAAAVATWTMAGHVPTGYGRRLGP